MEVLKPFVQDIIAMLGPNGLIIQLLLRVGIGDECILAHVIPKPVRRLRILPRCLYMGIMHLVSRRLELRVVSRFKVLIQLLGITPILDAKVYDFSRCPRIREIERGRGIKFDILSCEAEFLTFGEALAANVEELYGKATGLRDAVLSLMRIESCCRRVKADLHQGLGHPAQCYNGRHKDTHRPSQRAQFA